VTKILRAKSVLSILRIPEFFPRDNNLRKEREEIEKKKNMQNYFKITSKNIYYFKEYFFATSSVL